MLTSDHYTKPPVPVKDAAEQIDITFLLISLSTKIDKIGTFSDFFISIPNEIIILGQNVYIPY